MSRVAVRQAVLMEGYGLLPLYEVCVQMQGASTYTGEVRQLPSPATPRLRGPERLGALGGRNLQLIEARVLRKLRTEHIAIGNMRPGETRCWNVTEDTALHLALLFRVLAPMQNVERMRQCADRVDAMSREEASYWLGMAMHRPNPRRVLQALRILLSEA